MKRVLVILYYWPPGAGGGVMRWLKFVRYLPEFGWKPIVYAPENPDYPLIDPSLVQEVPDDLEVIRHPIIEPRRLYGWLVGKRDVRKGEADELFHRDPSDRSLIQNAIVWLRGNLLVPDARALWIRPSIGRLADYLRDHAIDAIVTSGPPHSLHLIGRGLKRKTGIPWVADFRDPWTDIEYYDRMMLTPVVDRLHTRLETSVLRETDAAVSVLPGWERSFSRIANRTEVITNGFDSADFENVEEKQSKDFLLAHTGTLSLDRNPEALWTALSRFMSEVPSVKDNLRIELCGKTDPAVLESAARSGLKEHVVDRGYVSHEEAIRTMKRAHVLLLFINQVEKNAKECVPGKLFEYLAAERPILLIGPKLGDSARIIEEQNAGVAVDFNSWQEVLSELRTFYHEYLRGGIELNAKNPDRFTRRQGARRMAELLTEVSG